MNYKNFIADNKLAFVISLIYVSLGTLSVCSVYPQDFFYGNWSLYGLLITFPASVISFGYRYAESDSLIPVFIIQIAMFILIFLILSKFIKSTKQNHINI